VWQGWLRCFSGRGRGTAASGRLFWPPQRKNGKSAVQMALRGALPLGKIKMGERKKRIGKFAAAGRLPAADGR